MNATKTKSESRLASLNLAIIGIILGLLLGYSMAYISRLIQIIYLDAVLIGLLGGSLMLFYSLLTHVQPGRWILSVSLCLAIGGWYGQAYGDYSFTKRSVSRAGTDPVVETIGLETLEPVLDTEQLEKERARALTIYEDKLESETGHRGLKGYILHRWQDGVVALGLGPNRSRISMPKGAAAAMDLLGIFLSMALSLLVLRRLGWVKRCPDCGRYLEEKNESTSAETGEDSLLSCHHCEQPETSRAPEASS